MAIDFVVKDIMHKITAKFIHAFLPDAKKPYYLRAVHQPELNVHGIASKADVYNITTSPRIIEDGFNAAIKLIYYLTADGYKIKTPLFNLRMRVPGEYDGAETHLPAGIFPVARMQPSASLREYLKERVQVQIDGKDDIEGYIAQATDEATGLVDEVATVGNILTIHGYGLKLESPTGFSPGVFFKPATGVPIEATVIAVNEPRTLKLVVPAALTDGQAYSLVVQTWSSAKTHAHLVKDMRDMCSDFTLTAHKT
jgi:hypothetical protein